MSPSPTGVSNRRLQQVDRLLQSYVDSGRLPGCACLVSRGGQEVHYFECGQSDVERHKPVERDTIYRIYSMTKPITSVALMMLYEEGHFQLDDPVEGYIPQWANLRVFADGDADAFTRTPLKRPMTIKDLLTHTSGLTYGFMHTHPVDALYRRHRIGGVDLNGTLEDMVIKLADLPLQFSPGDRWNYGVSTDVVSYLVERFSGERFDDFLRERITGPLAMEDTAFFVPADEADRFAACYEKPLDAAAFRLSDDPAESSFLTPPTFLSGGGGLVGTIDDYHAFTRVLLGRGESDGVRLLGRKTAEYMTLNHIPENRDLAAMGQPRFSETPYDGIGFGLGFSVVLDPAKANVVDSAGDFGWGGLASTYFWVDPAEELIVIFMTQLIPSSSYPIRRQLKTAVYQALL